MATTIIRTTPPRDAGRGGLARLRTALGAGFAAVMSVLSGLSTAYRRAMELQRLTALSDAELASRGLRRDEIVSHVFRDDRHA